MRKNALAAGSGLILLLMAISGCRQDQGNGEPEESRVDLANFKHANFADRRVISYTLSLPVEMAKLFDQVGANFYPDLLHAADDYGKYDQKVKIALNLGVYGVDLSYAKMFEQPRLSIAYLKAIHQLAGEMGIPRSIYGNVMNNLETLIQDKDSLSRVAANLYFTTDEFLKNDGQEGAASLVAMGGWIESMYIATRIWEMDRENITLQDKIAEQKYTLNSLIALMNNYHSDLELAEYLLMLKNLRRTFDQFQLYYRKGEVSVDTSRKTIATGSYYVNVTPRQMQEIADKIDHLRTLIVH